MTRTPGSPRAAGGAVHPSFADATRFWAKLGVISFGGPTGQIAIMHEEIVNRRRWISESRFLHALSYCMVLPGPEAQQLATYIGWLLHGVPGGIVAGSLFVLPSLVLLLGLSWAYAAFGHLPALHAVLAGLKPVVIAIVATALWRIASKSLRTAPLWILAAGGFVAMAVWRAPFPVVVLLAGLTGFAGARVAPAMFRGGGGHGAGAAEDDGAADTRARASQHTSTARMVRVALVGAACWIAPVTSTWLLRDRVPVLLDQALFFSKAALVTIGGAYAVLPYIAFAGINTYAWITPDQMLDGLALGETTPGPLIMVTTFVGFLGGWKQHGAWSPLTTALVAGCVTTYFTFLFSFLFIFLGAPYVERFRAHAALAGALTGVSAAVVGVIATLAVYLGAHVFVADGRIDPIACALAAAAFYALRVRGWSIHWVVLGGVMAGGVLALVRG